jgi:hypothetical protein
MTNMPPSPPPATEPRSVAGSTVVPTAAKASISSYCEGTVATSHGHKKPVLTASDKLTFHAILEGIAANPKIATISNRYPWQARMAVEKLLTIAKDKKLPIRIITGRGPEGFYNEGCCGLLAACKKNGCSIQILVWQKDSNGISPSLLKLAEDGVVSLRISGTDDNAGAIPHFLLVGDKAFRQEAGHNPFTNDTLFSETEPQVPARIDFEDPVTGKVLLEFFDKLWG